VSELKPGRIVWQEAEDKEVESDPEVHGEVRIQRRTDGTYHISAAGLCPEFVYYAVMSAYWQQRLQMLARWQPNDEETPPPPPSNVPQ
jgi:hypothetical protein